MVRLEWAEAEQALKRALELNPSDVGAHLSMAEWVLCHGDRNRAVALARQARSLDPLSARTGTSVALLLSKAGQLDEGLVIVRLVLAERPNYMQAEFVLGAALSANGQIQEAIACLERASELSGRSPGVLAILAQAYAQAGRPREARRLVDEILSSGKNSWLSPFTLAMACVTVGEHGQAIEWLERGFRERSRGIYLLPTTATFDPLRTDSSVRCTHEERHGSLSGRGLPSDRGRF